MESSAYRVDKWAGAGPDIEARRAQFEHLVASSRERAFTVAQRLTRNRTEADDLVQDTFVKAWCGFAGFRPDRPFINWILRIMRHAFVDHKRLDNPIRCAESLNSIVSPADGGMREVLVIDPAGTPLDKVVTRELRDEIRCAIMGLPKGYRVAVLLRDVVGLCYVDIALQTGTSLGTVRSRIHRGRWMLRNALSLETRGLEHDAFGVARMPGGFVSHELASPSSALADMRT
jgi:RNA polymerase sigma-70 factor (ECF subfamily)